MINPRIEDDEECFKWAVIAVLHHDEIEKDPQRISKIKKFEKLYNWKKLEFHMALSKIDNFERRNPHIAVNVLTTQSSIGVYTCRKSKHLDRKHNVNLFLWCDEEKKHYIAVKNLSGVLSKLNSNHRGVEHYCIDCLQGFPFKQARDGHSEYCKDNDATKIEIPKEGSKVKFHGAQYQFNVPFMLYADFESTLKPNEDKGARDLARYKDKTKQLEQKEEEESFTEKINAHIISHQGFVFTQNLLLEKLKIF